MSAPTEGNQTTNKKVLIETWGCQMNQHDSELIEGQLREHGMAAASDAGNADLVILNTCSVREQAENKTYSALGRLRAEKKKHPEKIIGVMGCMAQKDQKLIFQRAPYVDIVVGPGQLKEIPSLIAKARREGGQHTAVSLGRTDGKVEQIKRSHETFDPLRDPSMRPTPFQAFLRIQIGCDKFCTYCIVPMTRGPEQGREPAMVLDEARILADQGCKEITLLGQPFVKDDKVSVGKLLDKAGAKVTAFVRFEVGEGIEKKQENFADEVMKQIEDAKNKG